jgi:hypothetical protein
MKLMNRGAGVAVAVSLAVCCPGQADPQGPTSTFSFLDIQPHRLNLPFYSFTGFAVSPSGTVYSTINEKREVQALAIPGGQVRNLRLRDLPEEVSHWQLGPEVAGDWSGYLYVAGHSRELSFREVPSSRLLGVSVFKPDGRYSFQMSLMPSIEIMHMVVDDFGNLFALGVELESLYSPFSPCSMVHKYSRQGTRLTEFSSCPPADDARPVDQSPGRLLSSRENDARSGQLFFYDGFLYHVMFPLRTIRVFEASGRLVRELRLDPPRTDAPASTNSLELQASSRDEVTHVVVLRGGRFLVEWAHVEHTNSGSNKLLYLRIHDGDGRILTRAGVAPVTPSMLLYADTDDHVYFLGVRAVGQQELIRTRLALR